AASLPRSGRGLPPRLPAYSKRRRFLRFVVACAGPGRPGEQTVGVTRGDGGRPHTTRTMLVLGPAALAFALGQTTLIPAIPELIRALRTDESGVTWTVTGYLLAAAVFTPLVGRLGDIYGKRR